MSSTKWRQTFFLQKLLINIIVRKSCGARTLLVKWLCSAATLFRINFNYLKWKFSRLSFVFPRKGIFCIHFKLNGSLMNFQLIYHSTFIMEKGSHSCEIKGAWKNIFLPSFHTFLSLTYFTHLKFLKSFWKITGIPVHDRNLFFSWVEKFVGLVSIFKLKKN